MNIHIADHPLFKRDKADVLMDVPITFAEAALGTQIVVPTPEGKKVSIKVPAGCESGTVLKVKGKGAPRLGTGATGTGDLLLTLHVAVPKTLNDKQKEALEAFQAATSEEVRAW